MAHLTRRTADEIISIIAGPLTATGSNAIGDMLNVFDGTPQRTQAEWDSIARGVNEWLNSDNTPQSEISKLQDSGFLEMLQLCSSVLEREQEKEGETE